MENKDEKLKGPQPTNIVQMPSRCPVDKCGKKATRSEFCEEHFIWFKEGLINRKGEKPKDFDKKYQAFMRRKAA
ncbi:MAG: hypothetical protein KDD22_07340 [Bdellovibrionales bacterium]|nr:hypothetical protein [Bdellovibrionales bacterium]